VHVATGLPYSLHQFTFRSRSDSKSEADKKFEANVHMLRLFMEQRAVIRVFTLKGLKAKPIQAELESVYGTDACKLSMVKKWRSRFLQGRTTLFNDPRSGRPLTQDLAEAVRSMLDEKPFTSCRILCRHFRIAKTTCLRILHDELGLQQFHLHWVPHALLSNQKSDASLIQVSFSRSLKKHRGWVSNE
jgi:transposase